MQSDIKPNVLALIPAYNESERIAAVIRATCLHLPVLVVDDGSSDITAEIARQAGAEVELQRPNQGKGAALIRGFRYALEKGYDAVITLDADGQHDPEEIPIFLEAFALRKADLIIGARDFRKMPQPRQTSNTLGTWMFSWAVGQHIPDNQSGYRLISRRLMETMLHSKEGSFEFEVDMIVQAINGGMLLDWVPIRTIYAGEKSHIRYGRHIVQFTRMVWRARRSRGRAR
jgi:glycosyltransferase involved in cell wall biosynthesis